MVKGKRNLKCELEEKKILKSCISMKKRMSKFDQYGESTENNACFYVGTAQLRGEHDIDAFYDESVKGILEDFAEFNENGSNWVFERVLDMQVNTVGI